MQSNFSIFELVMEMKHIATEFLYFKNIEFNDMHLFFGYFMHFLGQK